MTGQHNLELIHHFFFLLSGSPVYICVHTHEPNYKVFSFWLLFVKTTSTCIDALKNRRQGKTKMFFQWWWWWPHGDCYDCFQHHTTDDFVYYISQAVFSFWRWGIAHQQLRKSEKKKKIKIKNFLVPPTVHLDR